MADRVSFLIAVNMLISFLTSQKAVFLRTETQETDRVPDLNRANRIMYASQIRVG